MKSVAILILLSFVLPVSMTGCKERTKKNTIKDVEQVDIDGSTDYKYIFREEIEKDKARERRKVKNEFAK